MSEERWSKREVDRKNSLEKKYGGSAYKIARRRLNVMQSVLTPLLTG